MTWDGVSLIDQNGVIILYEVEYNQSTFDDIEMSSTTTTDNPFVVLTMLEEYTQYSLRVRAYTTEGPGPYSVVALETTMQDSEFLEVGFTAKKIDGCIIQYVWLSQLHLSTPGTEWIHSMCRCTGYPSSNVGRKRQFTSSLSMT